MTARLVWHKFVLVDGPFDGYVFGGCPGYQCYDPNCDRLPAVITAWDDHPDPECRGVYRRDTAGSISSDGPFDVVSGAYKWEPAK